MTNLVIHIPDSIAQLLEAAINSSEELVIKTRDISLELTSGQLTKCEFKVFHLSKDGGKPEVAFTRPRPRLELVENNQENNQEKTINIAENKNQEKTINIALENKIQERREAIVDLIRSMGGKPLKMGGIASHLSKIGYTCVASTVSVDINALLKSGRISFYHERGSGRIYRVQDNEPRSELDIDFVF